MCANKHQDCVISQLRQETSALRSQVVEARAASLDCPDAAERQAVKDELHRLSIQISAVEMEKASARKELDFCRENMQSAMANLRATQSLVHQHQTANARLEEDNQKMLDKISSLNRQIQDLGEKEKEFVREAEVVQQEKQKQEICWKEKISAAEKETEQAQIQLQSTVQTLEAAREEYLQIRDRLEEVTSKLHQAETLHNVEHKNMNVQTVVSLFSTSSASSQTGTSDVSQSTQTSTMTSSSMTQTMTIKDDAEIQTEKEMSLSTGSQTFVAAVRGQSSQTPQINYTCQFTQTEVSEHNTVKLTDARNHGHSPNSVPPYRPSFLDSGAGDSSVHPAMASTSRPRPCPGYTNIAGGKIKSLIQEGDRGKVILTKQSFVNVVKEAKSSMASLTSIGAGRPVSVVAGLPVSVMQEPSLLPRAHLLKPSKTKSAVDKKSLKAGPAGNEPSSSDLSTVRTSVTSTDASAKVLTKEIPTSQVTLTAGDLILSPPEACDLVRGESMPCQANKTFSSMTNIISSFSASEFRCSEIVETATVSEPEAINSYSSTGQTLLPSCDKVVQNVSLDEEFSCLAAVTNELSSSAATPMVNIKEQQDTEDVQSSVLSIPFLKSHMNSTAISSSVSKVTSASLSPMVILHRFETATSNLSEEYIHDKSSSNIISDRSTSMLTTDVTVSVKQVTNPIYGSIVDAMNDDDKKEACEESQFLEVVNPSKPAIAQPVTTTDKSLDVPCEKSPSESSSNSEAGFKTLTGKMRPERKRLVTSSKGDVQHPVMSLNPGLLTTSTSKTKHGPAKPSSSAVQQGRVSDLPKAVRKGILKGMQDTGNLKEKTVTFSAGLEEEDDCIVVQCTNYAGILCEQQGNQNSSAAPKRRKLKND